MSDLIKTSPVKQVDGIEFSDDRGSDIIFHLHIPKTAGTALREALKNGFGSKHVLEWYPENPHLLERNVPALAERLKDSPQTRVVTGHFVYGVHRALKDRTYKYVTVVRHPIDRILSHIVHDIKRNLTHNFESENLLYLDRLLNYLETPRISYFYNNLQSRYITGVFPFDFNKKAPEKIVEEAISNVKRDFIFVGHQDRIGDTFHDLFSNIGIAGAELKNENTGLMLRAINVFPEEIYERLRENNSMDFHLIKALFPETEEPATRFGSVAAFDSVMINCYRESIANLVKQNKELTKYCASLNKIIKNSEKRVV